MLHCQSSQLLRDLVLSSALKYASYQHNADIYSTFSLSLAYPYCGLLSYTEDGAVSFFCTDAPSLTYFGAYGTGTSLSSSQPTQVVQSFSSIVVSSSSMFVSSSTNSITASPVPFTQSQQTASTTSMVSATSATSP